MRVDSAGVVHLDDMEKVEEASQDLLMGVDFLSRFQGPWQKLVNNKPAKSVVVMEKAWQSGGQSHRDGSAAQCMLWFLDLHVTGMTWHAN